MEDVFSALRPQRYQEWINSPRLVRASSLRAHEPQSALVTAHSQLTARLVLHTCDLRYTPVISAVRGRRKDKLKFEDSLCYGARASREKFYVKKPLLSPHRFSVPPPWPLACALEGHLYKPDL